MQQLESFLKKPQTRRWLLVLGLATLTLAVHALLSVASPTLDPATSSHAVDFRLPSAVSAVSAGAPITATPATTQMPPAIPQHTVRQGPVSVGFTLDRRSVLAGGDGTFYAEVVIQGDELPGDHRVPTDMIVVIDHSGSMAGEKIVQARDATLDLISRLKAEDRFALIAFSHGARLLIEPSPATGKNRIRWRRVIRQIEAGGSTNMVAGIEHALSVLRHEESARPRRVLLLSDGHPNSEHGLLDLARSTGRKGAALSALGIGTDFNESLMGSLADAGTGNYYYLDRPERMAAVFAGELDAGRGTLARGLEIHFDPAAGLTLVDAAGYPLEKRAGTFIIRPGDLHAGQTRRLWLQMKVDAEDPFPRRSLGDLDVSFRVDDQRLTSRFGEELRIACVSDREQFFSGIDHEAWGRAVVSEEYGQLQNEVAGFVRGGQKKKAQQAIERYLTRQSQQNAVVQNAEVSANLAEVEELRMDVEEAFQGADQMTKQIHLSKERHELSMRMRRIGSTPDAKSSGGGR